jgi:eukaryotic-like serine/threonine-protein kinase
LTIQAIKNRYISIERIKRGGQKVVYKAKQADGIIVALKIISNGADPRVLQEINIVEHFSLPNIPKVLESGMAMDETIGEEVLYIVEEFIEGISLRDWLLGGNKFNLTQAFKILHKLLETEIELEKCHVLHRDINPNNVILGSNGMIYLIDFGLAKNLDGTSLTRTEALHGPFTPGYAPHEQFANMKLNQDVRTDLFQIGVTIYEGCNGKNPFVIPNETVFQIMSRTMTVMPPVLNFNGDKKGMFSQFVNMLMAKNQSQRPDTAVDAMRYLNAIKTSLDLEG